jgi:hypothetical protein
MRSFCHRRVVVTFVVTLTAGCSSAATQSAGDLAGACAAVVPGDDLSCRGEIATANCPATWAAIDKTVSCNDCRYYVGQVDGFLTKFTNCNPLGNGGGSSCFYDAETKMLAGAVIIADVSHFCCDKSAAQLSGAVTKPLAMKTDVLAVRQCGLDAGATD